MFYGFRPRIQSGAEADGHSRVPQPIADSPPDGNRLRLLTPAAYWLLSNSFANDERVAKELDVAEVGLHPDDATARSLEEGDEAKLSNETGELVLRVRLAEEIRPGVALSHNGRWSKRERNRANVNVLNPGMKVDLGESAAVHGVEVTVEPVITDGVFTPEET